MKRVKVAGLQTRVLHAANKRDVCMRSADRLLRIAGRFEVDIACLPELFLGSQIAPEPIPGKTTREVGAYAREYGMYIIANTFIELESGIRHNANILFDRNGDVLGYQPKMHLWPWEGSKSFIQPPRQGPGVVPGSEFKIFNLDFGKIGTCVCHDHCFPESARVLTIMGAEAIFCTTRMPDPFQMVWREISLVRSIENQVYVVSVGAHYNYCSTHIVAPLFRGGFMAEAGFGERAITATLELEWLRNKREDSPLYYVKTRKDGRKALRDTDSFCFLKDRRPKVYGEVSKTPDR